MNSTQEYWRRHDEECGLERLIQLSESTYDREAKLYTKYPTIDDYQMEVDKITESLLELNFDDEESLSFKAAVIILLFMRRPRRRFESLVKATDYTTNEVRFIMRNLSENGILSEGFLQIDYYEDPLVMYTEITMCAMCGAGEAARKVVLN